MEDKPTNLAPWKPNAKHDHVFVVLRYETEPAHPEQSIEQRITTTRAFWSKEEAEAEVSRLNESNRDKSCLYFWGVARLGRKSDVPEAVKAGAETGRG